MFVRGFIILISVFFQSLLRVKFGFSQDRHDPVQYFFNSASIRFNASTQPYALLIHLNMYVCVYFPVYGPVVEVFISDLLSNCVKLRFTMRICPH
ncbi:unnamed protein product [Ceratitis capitata]|uniref:(Mediterranean fruit fly) hypothetical protein n=1 Tax=Ceratitis capitata TaxID=7213 RepID=A0A811V5Z8_CERCA|nr:unnamed protein product [Ceratitis capitata]